VFPESVLRKTPPRLVPAYIVDGVWGLIASDKTYPPQSPC
jgi:hypothetical protein